MTADEININAVREVHPLISKVWFIKKPITADALVRSLRSELESLLRSLLSVSNIKFGPDILFVGRQI